MINNLSQPRLFSEKVACLGEEKSAESASPYQMQKMNMCKKKKGGALNFVAPLRRGQNWRKEVIKWNQCKLGGKR